MPLHHQGALIQSVPIIVIIACKSVTKMEAQPAWQWDSHEIKKGLRAVTKMARI